MSPEMEARLAAFMATGAELKERRRRLMESAAEMPPQLFDRAKTQLDAEREAWRAEGERLKMEMKDESDR